MDSLHSCYVGIGMEGIGCILAGAFGSGSGTTSYSENIGAIGITKVSLILITDNNNTYINPCI